MRYILLLRGINVGGKNKVVMSELKTLLEGLNFQNVHSYINSGNLFFSTTDTLDICICKIKDLLERHYDFSIPFALLTKEEYLKDANEIRDFGIIVIMLAIVATVTVAVIWSRKYTQPIELLMKNMHHIKNQEFNIDKPKKLGWEELDRLNEELYSTAQSIKAYIERLKQVEDEKRREELMALQYQMNPHFLLNSLNSIRWMAMMTNNTILW